MWPKVKWEPDPTLTQGQQQPLGSSCSLGSMELRLLHLLGYMPIHYGLAPFPSGSRKNFDPFSGNWSNMPLKKQFNVTFQLFFLPSEIDWFLKQSMFLKKSIVLCFCVLLSLVFPGFIIYSSITGRGSEHRGAEWGCSPSLCFWLCFLPSGKLNGAYEDLRQESLQAPELILFSPKKFTIDDYYTSILWQIRSSVLNNLRKKHFSK